MAFLLQKRTEGRRINILRLEWISHLLSAGGHPTIGNVLLSSIPTPGVSHSGSCSKVYHQSQVSLSWPDVGMPRSILTISELR